MSIAVQILFAFVYLFGFLLGLWSLQNAVRGLLSGSFLVPDFSESNAALKGATRRESPFWLGFFFVFAMMALGLSSYGTAMLWELQGGLGRFDRLFPRPEGCEVIYLQETEIRAEAGLACAASFESLYRHYLNHARQANWQTLKKNAMMLELALGERWVRISVARMQNPDEQGHQTKVILELRE